MYNEIADSYDMFNRGFDYAAYWDTIQKELRKFHNPFGDKIALDCGCGTGSLIELLLKEGFLCTGVDASPEMLSKAQKKPGFGNVQLICQDLREIDLYRAYNVAFCTLDTINHILDKRALKAFFGKIYHFIEPNGFLIFDAKTEAGIKKSVATSVYDESGSTLIFDGTYQKPYAAYRLTVFSPENGSYQKRETQIEERFYPQQELEELAGKALKKVKIIPYRERKIYIYRKDTAIHE